MRLDLLDALLGHRLENGRLLGLLVPRCTSPRLARGVAAMGKTRPARWYITVACPETATTLVAAYRISANLVLCAPSAKESAHCPVNSIDDRRPVILDSSRSKDGTYLQLRKSLPGPDGMS